MEYGYMVNEQLIRVKAQTANSKPLVYTDEPFVDKYHATAFSWEDKVDTIEQVWETYEIEPAEEPTDIDNDELINILLGGETE